jgi:hypothetical protein
MTNPERKERRREAALKAAATRRQTAEEAARRAESAEAKRLLNLRAVMAEALRIRREQDLRYFAHLKRWSHHPTAWTAEQIDLARQFLDGFTREDGTPCPYPTHRRGRRRL